MTYKTQKLNTLNNVFNLVNINVKVYYTAITRQSNTFFSASDSQPFVYSPVIMLKLFFLTMGKTDSRLANKDTVASLIRMGKWFCVISALIPIAILFIRYTHYQFLTNLAPGLVAMNPLASIITILLCIALWCKRNEDPEPTFRKISNTLCIIVLLICTSRLIGFMFNINIDLDRLIFGGRLTIPQSENIEHIYRRMDLSFSFCTLLLAVSILFIDIRNRKIYSHPQTLNYFIIFITFLTIYIYIYSLDDIYNAIRNLFMTFQSAICLLFLSTATLFLRPYKGTMLYLIEQSPTDVFLMRFLAFFVPLLIGFAKIKGERNQLFDQNSGTAVMAASTYLISMALLGWKSSIQVSLQKAKQRKLKIIRKDRKRLERILNNSQTYIQIIDIEKDNVVFSNATGKGSFKGSKDIEGTKISDRIKKSVHPEDMPIIEKRFDRLTKLKDDEIDDEVFRNVDEDKNVIWLLSRVIVYKRKNGHIAQFLTNSVDITEEKQEEEELRKKQKHLKEKQQELEEAGKKLKEANKKLHTEVRRQSEDLYQSEKRYHDYIRNSFEGIIEYEHKDGGIDINLPVKEQIRLLMDTTVIKDVNKVILETHGYKKADDLRGMKLVDFLRKMPREQIEAFFKQFIESDYRLHGVEPTQVKESNKSIQVYINVLGMIRNEKLAGGWELQTRSKV